MKAYKCDICGNYKDNAKIIFIPEKLDTSIRPLLYDSEMLYKYDCCEECYRVIKNIIEERKVVGKIYDKLYMK